MTKSHGLHRKKAIHLKFRRSPRVRRLFWRVTDIFDGLANRQEGLRGDIKGRQLDTDINYKLHNRSR